LIIETPISIKTVNLINYLFPFEYFIKTDKNIHITINKKTRIS